MDMTAISSLVEALHNPLTRVRPAPEDLAQRTPILLTDRDQAILTALAIHGYLTKEMIEVAFFPPACSGRKASSRFAYKRLRELWLWDLIERVELTVPRRSAGRRPLLFGVGKRGLSTLAAGTASTLTPGQRRRSERLDSLFLAHDLTAAAVWAHLQPVIRSGCITGCRWVHERELKARRVRVRDPATDRLLPVLPDAYVELTYPDGTVQSCMLEVDMGTLTLERFGRKLRAFEEYLRQGLFAKQWQRSAFEVLVLTHSEERLRRLWEIGRREVPRPGWRWYSFATFDVLTLQQFTTDDAWLTLEGDATGLLYDRSSPNVPLSEETTRGP